MTLRQESLFNRNKSESFENLENPVNHKDVNFGFHNFQIERIDLNKFLRIIKCLCFKIILRKSIKNGETFI